MGEMTTMQMLRRYKKKKKDTYVYVNQVVNETNTFFALFENTAFFQYYRKNKIRKEMTIEEEQIFPGPGRISGRSQMECSRELACSFRNFSQQSIDAHTLCRVCRNHSALFPL